MSRVVVIGTSGHAKVIIDMLQEIGQMEIVGCTAGNRAEASPSVLEVPVLGDDSVLPELYSSGVRKAFVAIGDNRRRGNVMRDVTALGFELVTVISRQAIVSRRVKLGVGVAVMPGAVINVSTEVGDGSIINTGATVDHDCRLERLVHIAPGTNLAGFVTLGEGAFLGTGTSVIPKISIGPWAIVGAGTVVIKDIPGSVTAVGVPAAILSADRSKGK
jgi:UDP-perosamine 4-acetyltransferase